MILSTVIQLPKSIKLDDYFFILARKRSIAAIMSSVERGVVVLAVARVAVALAPNEPAVRVVFIEFNVLGFVLVVVEVVTVLTTRGLYIDEKELVGRVAVVLAGVVGRVAKLEVVALLLNELVVVVGRAVVLRN